MRQMGTTMSKVRLAAKSFVAVALTLLVWGCATGRTSAPEFSTSTGQHPAAWMQNHWVEYSKNPEQCRTCHGSTKDAAQAGGTSGVSCFKCHTSPDHPAGWAARTSHGRLGAQAAPGMFQGFADCAKCHGSDFAGGTSGVSCKSCHTKAPHADRPWLGGNAGVPNHSVTNEANAAECAKCHLNGANSTHVPSTPAPPLTAPGCYNNTLCHDRNLSVAGLSDLGR